MDPIASVLDSLRAAVEHAPFAVLAAALLIGPTLLWVFLRVVFPSSQKDTAFRRRMLWGCPNCRSVNESVHTRCYACGFEPQSTDDVTIIDPTTGRPLTRVVNRPAAPPSALPTRAASPGVAVGPGRSPGPVASPAPTRAAQPVMDPAAVARPRSALDLGAKRPFPVGARTSTTSADEPVSAAAPFEGSTREAMEPVPEGQSATGSTRTDAPAVDEAVPVPVRPRVSRPASIVASGEETPVSPPEVPGTRRGGT